MDLCRNKKFTKLGSKRIMEKSTMNVLIVDDEKQERQVINHLLAKMEKDFNIFEAKNGEEGIYLLDQRPFDILITDVKMPYVSGLEVADHARKVQPTIEVIFFSGYGDYDYLKKALLVNAVTYILKPVNPDEFFEVMELTINKIEQKNNQLSENEKERIIRGVVIRELMNGATIDFLKEKYEAEVDVHFLDTITFIAIFQISTKNDSPIISAIEKEIIEQNSNMACIRTNVNQLLLYFLDEQNEDVIKKKMESVTKNNQKLESYSIIKKIESKQEIFRAYTIGSEELKRKAFFHQQHAHTKFQGTNDDVNEEMMISAIIKAINIEDQEIFSKKIQNILNFHTTDKELPIPFIKFFYANFVERLYTETKIEIKDTKEVTIQNIIDSDNIHDILEVINKIIDSINSYLAEPQDDSALPIKKVKRYISLNYDKDLYLDLLGQEVGLSAAYLSELFKKEEGIGINHYIKSVRMNEARELLLKTNLKISQIAQKVGYQNYPYFIKLFRQEMGIPPEEYRQKYYN